MRLDSDIVCERLDELANNGGPVTSVILSDTIKLIRELEEGLKHIRDYRYSGEQCRDIAAETLKGSGTYTIPTEQPIDLFPEKEPWEAYELACKEIISMRTEIKSLIEENAKLKDRDRRVVLAGDFDEETVALLHQQEYVDGSINAKDLYDALECAMLLLRDLQMIEKLSDDAQIAVASEADEIYYLLAKFRGEKMDNDDFDVAQKMYIRCIDGNVQITDEGDPSGFEYIRADVVHQIVERAFREGFDEGRDEDGPAHVNSAWKYSDTKRNIENDYV